MFSFWGFTATNSLLRISFDEDFFIVKSIIIIPDPKVCQENNRTDILLHITKVIAPTVKTQARGQNDLSKKALI